jgi:hypothetical protein
MVGIVSSSNLPVEIVFTNVVFPAFYNPTKAISNSFEKNLDRIQSKSLSNHDFYF